MNSNLELLNYIYKNAEMGQDTLTQLIKIAEQEDFLKLLRDQQKEYKEIFDECDKRINKLNSEPKGIGKITEISTYFMLNMKTLTDKTPSHIAGMVMQGSVMGIIDITKKLKEYKDADSSVIALGERLLKMEEHNLTECKKFL